MKKEKIALKCASNIVFSISGAVTGYKMGEFFTGKMRRKMEKKMNSSHFKNKSEEDKKKEIERYNVKSTAVDGFCSGIASSLAYIGNNVVSSQIDKAFKCKNHHVSHASYIIKY